MTAVTRPAAQSRIALWSGRVASVLVILFMAMDAASHLAKPVPVVTAFARLGVPLRLAVPIAVLALASTALYAIPRTCVLGAVLLTGYLGGAVAIQVRAGSPTFESLFPAILGVLLWGGLLLRDARLRTVFPLRS